MNVYLYNPTKCPQIFGYRRFLPFTYAVVTREMADAIRAAHVPVLLEGDENFEPLFVSN